MYSTDKVNVVRPYMYRRGKENNGVVYEDRESVNDVQIIMFDINFYKSQKLEQVH